MNFVNLRFALRALRMTQSALAKRVGMSPAGITRCLAGEREFKPKEREKIAQALGFPEAWLFRRMRLPRSSSAKAISAAVGQK